MASHASSLTLCAQSNVINPSTSIDDRLTAVEKIVASQQAMLEKLRSASEHCLPRISEDIYEPPPAPTPEEAHEPTPDLTPEAIYERARVKAGFLDHHKWNAAYIHGLIRVDGEQSKSITMDPPCGPCASSHNIAVCVSLAENDPYCGYLVYDKLVCCGWCEYERSQGVGGQQAIENSQRKMSPLERSEDQKTKEKKANSIYINGQDQEKLPARQDTFFISGEGLDREVIITEIPRFLGTDTLVRPGTHQVHLPRLSREIITNHFTGFTDV
jgi:hypothetical protein